MVHLKVGGPTITDDVGYQLGVCGEGRLLAAKSQIFFKPYESWTKDSEWTLECQKMKTDDIACGDDFVAVATSQNFLRVLPPTVRREFSTLKVRCFARGI